MSTATKKALTELTADDLMAGDIVLLPEGMPLRQAARLLLKNQIGGAPVVDSEGRCVGVLSSIDFLRLAERREDVTNPAGPPLPVTCSFQMKRRTADGRDVILCTLAPGVCPIQARQSGPKGEDMLVCREPRCVLVDWQIVEMVKLPNDEVRQFMTSDPVTVKPETPIRTLARMIIDAHIHRVIVVDNERRPIGIVSSTDLLAALAQDND
jgi:CBS-domain-containing membrane protein